MIKEEIVQVSGINFMLIIRVVNFLAIIFKNDNLYFSITEIANFVFDFKKCHMLET